MPAAERTIAVLQYLARHARPVAAAAVARDLDLPRSSVYHLLATLEQGRFVAHLPDEGLWALGVGAFELGQAYLRERPLERLGRPVLHRLAHDAGVAAHLAVLDGRDVVYLVTEHPPQTVPLVVDVGVRLPAHLTASGRVLLAEQTPAQIHASFPDAGSLSHRTSVGPASRREFRRILAAARRDGIGREDGEIDLALASVAVAARDHAGRAIAAVTLTFRTDDHAPLARAQLIDQARTAATQLSARLQH